MQGTAYPAANWYTSTLPRTRCLGWVARYSYWHNEPRKDTLQIMYVWPIGYWGD